MERHEFKILFLDDEIYEADNPAVFAKEALDEAGYSVEVTDSMSYVITASRRNYYHLYLLDIDMGKVDDEFDGNGATVGEVLRRLSSIRNVIVYSARGKMNDWLTAANYHFYCYVHKLEGEEKLLTIVNGLFERLQASPVEKTLPKAPEYSDTVVMYYKPCQVSLEYMKSQFESLVLVESISDIRKAVAEYNPKLALVVLPHTPKNVAEIQTFDRDIKQAMGVQPRPNVIICIEASGEGREFLKIVNAHPFRIVNMNSAGFESDLREAVNQAIIWYDDQEIFDFPRSEQIRYMPMSAEEIEALKPEDWESDDWEEAERQTSQDSETGGASAE